MAASVQAKYQPYPAYKHSGVEWLGDIPTDWNVKKLKYLCNVETGTRNTEDAIDDGKFPLFVRSQTVEHINSYCADCEVVLTAGDGVGVGKVFHYYEGKFDCHQRVYMLKDFRGITGRYIFYYLSTNFYNVAMNGNSKSTVDSLRLPQFLNFDFVFPDLETQELTVNFLDHETAKIDALIAKQQRLIALLEEKRQAMISHAVTKGLNPNAPLLPSGIDWLGDVPAHWEVSYLGFETTIKARLGWKGLKAEEYVDDGYIFLATPNIKGDEIDMENVNYITKKRYEESPEIALKVGDILVTKDGSTTGTINVVRNLLRPATVNSSIAVIRSSGGLDSVYMFFFFKSQYTQNVIKRMQDGMGVPHLFQADLRKFRILIPPPAEQKSIATHLEKAVLELNGLVSKANSAITLLKERRTALISAAVTGKIDLRVWQLPKFVSNHNLNTAEDAVA